MSAKNNSKKKKVYSAIPPSKFKDVRKNPLENNNKRISWHLAILDKEGPCGWFNLAGKNFWGNVLLKLRDFESMTWSDVLKNKKNHPIAISSVCSEAQKRLKIIKQDDIDELFSLRLSGKERIWGIRDVAILKILWWDPEHTVYPCDKKYT